MKDYLKGKTVYLAGSIRSTDDSGVGWRSMVTSELNTNFALNVLDPTNDSVHHGEGGEVGLHKEYFKNLIKNREFEKAKNEFWPIVRRDLRAVDTSHFVICYYDPTIPSVGTFHELVTASHNEKKPVLLYVPEDKLDQVNAWILTFIKHTWLFTNWEDMFSYLDKVDNGEFDSSKWIF